MKKLTLVLAMVFFGGCAHTHVESWAENKIEICGNQWASQETKVREATENGCKNPSPISGRIVRDSNRPFCTTFKCD